MPETLEEITPSTQGPQPPDHVRLLHDEHPRFLPLWVLAFLMACLSGLIMSACFWPYHLHFLAWIALVPWLIILPRISPLSATLFGTALGLVFYRISLNWIYVLYGPIGLIVVAGLAVLMGLAFRVARMMMKRFHMLSMVWVVPFAFVGQEILRSEALPQYRFAFLAWGYTQSHNPWIAQIASIGGVYFISFLLISFNAAVAYAFIRRRLIGLVPALVLGGIVLCLGILSQPPSYRNFPKIPVACVQSECADLKTFVELSVNAFDSRLKPRFVVLPEHTIFLCSPDLTALGEVSRKYNGYICVGAEGTAPKGSKCSYDNMGILIGPNGDILLKQKKAVPVPFMDDGNPAQTQTVLNTPHGAVGVYVCYDATFTDIPRRLVDRGAEILLGPVMDVAKWPEQERMQHAWMAPFRSIELRRCCVRAASSGISQIIDATGKVLNQRTQQEGPGILRGEIYTVKNKTLFVKGGYLFAPAVGFFFLIVVVILAFAEWIGNFTRKRNL